MLFRSGASQPSAVGPCAHTLTAGLCLGCPRWGWGPRTHGGALWGPEGGEVIHGGSRGASGVGARRVGGREGCWWSCPVGPDGEAHPPDARVWGCGACRRSLGPGGWWAAMHGPLLLRCGYGLWAPQLLGRGFIKEHRRGVSLPLIALDVSLGLKPLHGRVFPGHSGCWGGGGGPGPWAHAPPRPTVVGAVRPPK